MDLKPLFDSFYDKLILRDLFGKMTPGALFLVSLAASHYGIAIVARANEKLTTFSWALLLGLAWLLGFALQYVGERLRILRTHPHGNGDVQTRETFYLDWAEFQVHALVHERVHAERLNVIKEGCGNAAVSIALSAVAVLATALWEGERLEPYTPVAVTALLLFVCLWRSHVIHIERYGQFLQAAVKRHRSARSAPSAPTVAAGPAPVVASDA